MPGSGSWVNVNPLLCLLLDRGADTALVDTLDLVRRRELLQLVERCRTTESGRDSGKALE